MVETYTEEQLNQMSQKELSSIAISLQERLAAAEENYKNLDHTMQLILEELANAKRHRFGSALGLCLCRYRLPIFAVRPKRCILEPPQIDPAAYRIQDGAKRIPAP